VLAAPAAIAKLLALLSIAPPRLPLIVDFASRAVDTPLTRDRGFPAARTGAITLSASVNIR
jgi:hypothetical protein